MQEKIAFVFPGQGSQSQGMLSELRSEFSVVEKTFEQASESLGYDLGALIEDNPEEKLNQTEYTQPAIVAASVALWRLWQSQKGKQPEILAGHSLGEWSALVCASALPFSQALKLVAKRGQLMQSAVQRGQGGMAVVLGLDNTVVTSVCAEVSTLDVFVVPVNLNAPGQIVIAGHRLAIEKALLELKSAGAKRAVWLPVSVPSHCALMQKAAQAFALELKAVEFNLPVIPILQNADLTVHTTVENIQASLVKQLYSPVDWVSTIQQMVRLGVNTVVECGPGSVLSGLNKRIERALNLFSVYDATSLETALRGN